MKKILCILFVTLMFSCDNDNEPATAPIIEAETNKVVLLKVDFLTNAFEGAKELEFSASDSFTISNTFNPPGDFGDIQLYYNELDEMLFDGTIIWLGSGERSYPEAIDLPEDFATIDNNLDLPDSSMFQTVDYHETAYYPDTIDYSGIWNSISNLEIIETYRTSNPDGQINLFLYTPSVGVGNPAEWDWYIYIKN